MRSHCKVEAKEWNNFAPADYNEPHKNNLIKPLDFMTARNEMKRNIRKAKGRGGLLSFDGVSPARI